MTVDIENAQEPKRCPVCGSAQVFVFWERFDLPVHCNVLCVTRDEALNVPRGDIRLMVCETCGFIHNLAFDPERMRYGQSYENPLDYSPKFQAYAHTLAARLVERYDLHDKQIIEIACGKGGFLRLLCELGNNRGIGFDPGFVPTGTEDDLQDRITFVQEYYSFQHAHYKADLICCRQTLEHIHEPMTFLQMLRDNIGDRQDTVVFFEVPNVLFTLRDLGIWDILYEHCSYFSARALVYCFRRAGFTVTSVREAFGNQFLCVEAIPDGTINSSQERVSGGNVLMGHEARSFAVRLQKKLESWSAQLDQLQQQGRSVVVWGAGSKGVTFLNMVGHSERVKSVVDINPRKQGMYVAGTAHPIVAPEHLHGQQSVTIIVMNPLYEDEIRQMIERMDVSAELIIA